MVEIGSSDFESAELGKVSSAFLKSVVYSRLGMNRPEVVVGPSSGVDVCVIKIGSNQVLVLSTDPISLIPDLGPQDSAWMSVNLIANDLSTSGLKPQYFMVDLNLPPNIPDEVFAKYWDSMSAECLRLGIAIVGGNTGRFQGCDYTVIGAGMAFSMGSASRYVVSSGAKAGNKVILTKGAAISATGILAKVFPEKVENQLGTAGLGSAKKYFEMISGTGDALSVAELGVGEEGITAMHDVTEGGVLTALFELARASSLGATFEKSAIPVSTETVGVCETFGIDPYITLGEGAYLIACIPQIADAVLKKLESRGTNAAIVGELVDANEGILLEDHGRKVSVTGPFVDPYWNAYHSNAKAREKTE